jgi:hypothetical protein
MFAVATSTCQHVILCRSVPSTIQDPTRGSLYLGLDLSTLEVLTPMTRLGGEEFLGSPDTVVIDNREFV